MGLFRDNEKKIKRNITRLGIPTGKRRISWLFHMCGRGFELGAYGLQVQRSNLSATLLPHIVKLLRILPLLDWVLFSRFSAPPNLEVKTLATSFVIRSWWETLGTTLNLWCVIIRLLFQGIFYFRREKNTLDTSRFIKVVDHRNDCQNVEPRASPRRVV